LSLLIKMFILFFLGYEVNGLENVPIDSPALLVYYHGAIPIDLYYMISRIYLIKAKLVHTVADHFLFKLPGNYYYYCFCCTIC
jgi:1-acyl-sn-glycerol-3-phosphate acyltransferase